MYYSDGLEKKVSYHALRKEVPMIKVVSGSIYDLPVPANLSYL